LPVKLWAGVGALILVVEAVALVGWVTSGDAQPTDPGTTPVPGYMKAAIYTAEGLGLVLFAVFLYFFLVRPWKRTGRLTTDGLFCLVFATLFWQDPLMNYFQHQLTYNAFWSNHGSYVEHLPGWLAPNGRLLAQPLLFYPAYVWALFGAAVFGSFLMRRFHERRPDWSPTRLFVAAWCCFLGLELLVEPLVLRLGLWSYPGAIRWMTAFAGRYYQFPVYEGLALATLLTAWSALRYFRDDRGHTLAEKGLDQIQTTARRTTGLRFLALTGVANVICLGVYSLPMALSGLYASSWPEDVTSRSYLVNGLCGPGTTYSCSGPRIPIPRPDSAHLDPDGNLVVPSSTK
jgi:hypothetical protein